MSLSPLVVYIHTEKPIVQEVFVHYKCNITVLDLTVLYSVCVVRCFPKSIPTL